MYAFMYLCIVYVYMSICLSICLPVCLSVCLSVEATLLKFTELRKKHSFFIKKCISLYIYLYSAKLNILRLFTVLIAVQTLSRSRMKSKNFNSTNILATLRHKSISPRERALYFCLHATSCNFRVDYNR